MITRDIYCFHADLGNSVLNDTVPLWIAIWRKHGWTPHVLGISDAQQHPLYKRVREHGDSMPTVNHRGFSLANYVRWCAFARVNGAITDYDVLPRTGYAPKEYPPFYCGDACGGPGFIVGSCGDFESVVQTILKYSPQSGDSYNGQPHVCDMTILHRNKHLFGTIEDKVRCYGIQGWRDVPLTHFGNSYMKTSLPKAEEIREVLRQEGTICE